ncbi:HIT domain-containing protein [Candidatus Woesearchaeota archaeon]|nr:HIT domain-containing protein [Candidatus Woesearchaeota archaeon]
MAEQISQEQLRELQEKIKQMSPEELKEFQKKQCIFCQIVAGKIQAKKIYEDGNVAAILDINPANPGHILLLTKEHYSIMPQIPDDEIAHVFMVAKSLSNSMLKGIDAQGTNIIVANGVAAGQRAQHFMAHIIPRKENDGLRFELPQKTMEESEINAVGNRLAAALGGAAEEEKPAQRQEQKKEVAQAKKEPRQKKESDSNINLDDISRILGAK